MSAAAAPAPLRVCLVTGEYVGPRQCGGIGTATTGLAEHLARAGLDVTVLFTRGFLMSPSGTREWTAKLIKRGIKFVALDRKAIGAVRGPLADLTHLVPSAVLDYLQRTAFDLVHVNDLEAEGYLAIAARRMGVALHQTPIAAGLHSPRAWIEAIGKTALGHPVGIAMDAAERFTAEYCDVLWSPSRYLLDWIQANGFAVAERTEVQQYVMPQMPVASGDGGGTAARGPVKKIVFFGRLEERKGLFEFLDALDLTADLLAAQGIEVNFLGACTLIAGVPSGRIVAERAKEWRFAHRLLGALPHREALDFLRAPGCLAVMASPADNSPCTVYEAMAIGAPFIAAAAGGIPELIAADQAGAVLFEPNSQSLAAALRRAIENPPPIPAPAISQGEAAAVWSACHDREKEWPALAFAQTGQSEVRQMFGIVVQDNAISGALAATLASIKALSPAPAFVAVVSKNAGQLAEVVHPDRLAGWLEEPLRADADLLAIPAGVILDGAGVHALQSRPRLNRPLVILPSTVLEGTRIDAPVLTPAIALAIGPMPTGAIFIEAAARRAAMHLVHNWPGVSALGHFGGLGELAICAGSAVMPFPRAIGAVSSKVLAACRPVQTAQRFALFSSLPHQRNTGMAAMAAMQGLAVSRISKRALLFRALRGPLAPALPLLNSLAGKLFSRKLW